MPSIAGLRMGPRRPHNEASRHSVPASAEAATAGDCRLQYVPVVREAGVRRIAGSGRFIGSVRAHITVTPEWQYRAVCCHAGCRKAGPCPHCGGTGRVPDDHYRLVKDTAQLLRGRSPEQLVRLANVLQTYRDAPDLAVDRRPCSF
jgi:hypothetical protein